jgi:hypothetical protein
LNAAACIKKREDQLRRTTRGLRTRVAQWIQDDGEVSEQLLWTLTNLSFKYQIKIKIKLAACNLSFFIAIHNVLYL